MTAITCSPCFHSWPSTSYSPQNNQTDLFKTENKTRAYITGPWTLRSPTAFPLLLTHSFCHSLYTPCPLSHFCICLLYWAQPTMDLIPYHSDLCSNISSSVWFSLTTTCPRVAPPKDLLTPYITLFFFIALLIWNKQILGIFTYLFTVCLLTGGQS